MSKPRDDELQCCESRVDFYWGKYGAIVALLYCVCILCWVGSWPVATETERQAFYTVAVILLIATTALEVFCIPEQYK